MQRLVEQPTGDGEIFAGSMSLGNAHYHLSVYQHFSGSEDVDVPANVEVRDTSGRAVSISRSFTAADRSSRCGCLTAARSISRSSMERDGFARQDVSSISPEVVETTSIAASRKARPSTLERQNRAPRRRATVHTRHGFAQDGKSSRPPHDARHRRTATPIAAL